MMARAVPASAAMTNVADAAGAAVVAVAATDAASIVLTRTVNRAEPRRLSKTEPIESRSRAVRWPKVASRKRARAMVNAAGAGAAAAAAAGAIATVRRAKTARRVRIKHTKPGSSPRQKWRKT